MYKKGFLNSLLLMASVLMLVAVVAWFASYSLRGYSGDIAGKFTSAAEKRDCCNKNADLQFELEYFLGYFGNGVYCTSRLDSLDSVRDFYEEAYQIREQLRYLGRCFSDSANLNLAQNALYKDLTKISDLSGRFDAGEISRAEFMGAVQENLCRDLMVYLNLAYQELQKLYVDCDEEGYTEVHPDEGLVAFPADAENPFVVTDMFPPGSDVGVAPSEASVSADTSGSESDASVSAGDAYTECCRECQSTKLLISDFTADYKAKCAQGSDISASAYVDRAEFLVDEFDYYSKRCNSCVTGYSLSDMSYYYALLTGRLNSLLNPDGSINSESCMIINEKLIDLNKHLDCSCHDMCVVSLD